MEFTLKEIPQPKETIYGKDIVNHVPSGTVLSCIKDLHSNESTTVGKIFIVTNSIKHPLFCLDTNVLWGEHIEHLHFIQLNNYEINIKVP